MAHCENLINNTEDIVVAISHMVVGLCSVTILPLASTYVCQERAAMTSSSSAHLASPPLPGERRTLGGREGRCGGLGIPPWLLAWAIFVRGIRSEWGQNVSRRLGRPIKLRRSWERWERGGAGGSREVIIRACAQTKCTHAYEATLPNSHKQKNTCAHAHRRAQRHAKHALGHSQSNESSQLGSPSPGLAVFLQSERPC